MNELKLALMKAKREWLRIQKKRNPSRIVYQQVHPLKIKAIATTELVLHDGKVYAVRIRGLRQRSWQGNLFTNSGRAILGGEYDAEHSTN